MRSLLYWRTKVTEARTPLTARDISNYAPLFFWRNAGSFRAPWSLLIALSSVRNLLSFFNVFILSRIVSDFNELPKEEILTWHAPLWFISLAAGESIDYLTRRYAEALPSIFGDVTRRRFFAAILNEPLSYLQNISKERLIALVERYVGHVRAFLFDCEWSLAARATRLVIIVVVLAIQSPIILALNGLYIGIFLTVAFKLSAHFSTLAHRHSSAAVDLDSLQTNLILNGSFLQRVGQREFLHFALESKTLRSWDALESVRRFHARRWFIQLNLFNLMSFGTMLIGILQVKDGTFALGFLLLIKWSFDELWQILVYAIEYYVSLIQQRADATLLRDALAPGGLDAHYDATVQLNDWGSITLTDASIAFPATTSRNAIALNVPEVSVYRQDWVGIIGPSGAGKTTLLLMIANLLPSNGKLAIDGHPIKSGRISPEDLFIVTTSDPLFKISLRDNLSLGRNVTDAHLLRCLEAAGVDFAFSLDAVVGSGDFNLSAGQEQRIRLARGLAHSGSLLLLDEPFTALDSASRTLAQARMKDFLRSRTVVMVTHAVEDLDLVDRVYEVRNGTVVAVKRS